jgi:DNA polymerase III epsilon subunit-like protein
MIVFDTETTALKLPSEADLNSQPRIIEIGAIKLDERYREVARYSSLVNPGMLIDEEFHSKITGLTNAELKNAPAFLEVFSDLAEFFIGERRVIAHNVAFDMAVLSFDLQRINAQFAFPYPPKQFCTAQFTETKFGKRLKLVDWYEKVFGEKLKQTHRAVDDAAALASIVRKLKL